MQLRTEVENNSAREAEDGCSAARNAGEQFSSGSGVLEMITLLREMLKRKTPLQVLCWLVSGVWYLIFGIWHLLFGIWYLVFSFGIWYLDLVFGIWYLDLAFGILVF